VIAVMHDVSPIQYDDLAAILGHETCCSSRIVIVAAEAGYMAFLIAALIEKTGETSTIVDLQQLPIFGADKALAA
jgi:hypothetical protein